MDVFDTKNIKLAKGFQLAKKLAFAKLKNFATIKNEEKFKMPSKDCVKYEGERVFISAK